MFSRTLTRNIRERRGEKVAINIPIFKDVNTPSPFKEDYVPLNDDGEGATAAKPDHIYMDCMGFGMWCSCLQVTFQACNIKEARLLYDQLTPLCPILVSISRSSYPYQKYFVLLRSNINYHCIVWFCFQILQCLNYKCTKLWKVERVKIPTA